MGGLLVCVLSKRLCSFITGPGDRSHTRSLAIVASDHRSKQEIVIGFSVRGAGLRGLSVGIRMNENLYRKHINTMVIAIAINSHAPEYRGIVNMNMKKYMDGNRSCSDSCLAEIESSIK